MKVYQLLVNEPEVRAAAVEVIVTKWINPKKSKIPPKMRVCACVCVSMTALQVPCGHCVCKKHDCEAVQRGVAPSAERSVQAGP